MLGATANDSQWGPGFFADVLEEMSEIKGPVEPAIVRWRLANDCAQNARRPVPILRQIEGRKSAMVVVDMQRAFLDVGAAVEVPAGREIVPNINRIGSALRANGGLVVFLRYLVDERVGMLRYFEEESYLGPNRESPMLALRRDHPQFELYPSLDVRTEDLVIDKIRFSAVHGSNILQILHSRGIENVIVTGVTTDVCAGNTGESLMQMDFHVVMVWDGTAALDRLTHELFLTKFFSLYGDVMSTNEVIARLT